MKAVALAVALLVLSVVVALWQPALVAGLLTLKAGLGLPFLFWVRRPRPVFRAVPRA